MAPRKSKTTEKKTHKKGKKRILNPSHTRAAASPASSPTAAASLSRHSHQRAGAHREPHHSRARPEFGSLTRHDEEDSSGEDEEEDLMFSMASSPPDHDTKEPEYDDDDDNKDGGLGPSGAAGGLIEAAAETRELR
ncbi:uncharacterized protein PG986_004157 [Apiospora aurea]|uniref:Uncharacterized protein n=1 Tax=Apiospora aurea TaxID=335848 RepID=A0ABR1QM13_9PEZI